MDALWDGNSYSTDGKIHWIGCWVNHSQNRDLFSRTSRSLSYTDRCCEFLQWDIISQADLCFVSWQWQGARSQDRKTFQHRWKFNWVQTLPGAWNWPQDISWRFADFITSARTWTSLSVQWIRIRQPMQDTRVRSLVWGESTCCGPAKPGHRNYRGPSILEPVFDSKGSLHSKKPMFHNNEKPPLATPREKPLQQQRPSTAKNKFKKIFLKAVRFLGHKCKSEKQENKQSLYPWLSNKFKGNEKK